MHRLFLDANVLFSAAYRANNGLLQLWELRDAYLFSSRYAAEEARINLSELVQKTRLARLLAKVYLVQPGHRGLPEGVTLPEKNVPILLAAIEAQATHLLTGDIKHFGQYLGKRVEGIVIQLPGEYLRRRRFI